MTDDVPRLITDIDDVRRLVDRVRQAPAYTYDFETLGTRTQRLRVCGLGLAWGPGPNDGAYILTEHAEHPFLQWADVLPCVQPLLEDESITQIAHNSLFDASILDHYGVNLHTNTYDTMVMAWLLNTETPNGLKDLVRRLYGHQMTELSQFVSQEVVAWHPGKILRLDKAPIENLREYAIEDVTWTYRLWQDGLAALKEDPLLDRVYHELYQEYLPLLAQMQNDGVTLDLGILRQCERETREELERMVEQIIDLRPGCDFDGDLCRGWTAADIDVRRKDIPELQEKWRDKKVLRQLLYKYPERAHKVFNPGSNHQLNKVLFGELGLRPIGEKKKTGQYSVAADVLTKMLVRDDSGIVRALLRYSMLDKLQGTYHVGLQELVDDDGRVRTQYNATLKTGRLSSSQPNLMNIPARTDEGKQIRRAFVPRGPEWTMIVADYSQIEMRLLAHFSGDDALIEGFRRGADPHSITAKAIFDLDCDVLEVPEKFPTQRRIGKTANFAVSYGVGPETLATQIIEATGGEVTPSSEDAKAIRDSLMARMPGVRDWIRYQERLARRLGVVRSLIGRPRHLPDARSYDPARARAYFGALRRAVNSPIQSSAADVIGIAMRNIRREFIERGWWRERVFLVLQIHDELVFEVEREIAEAVLERVKWNMEHAVELDVPIVAEPAMADSWYDAK